MKDIRAFLLSNVSHGALMAALPELGRMIKVGQSDGK